MLREGPIPRFMHGIVEYAAGILFVGAPFLFGFDDGSAEALSILLGIGLLVFAAMTEGPTGMVSQISLRIHVALDFGVVILLIAAPFIFGFSGEAAPTAFFLVMGMAHLLVTIGTRFREI